MKCICTTTCQVRMPDGAIRFFNRGESADFDKCPVHFVAAEDAPVDFIRDSEEALMQKRWKISAAKAFLRTCGVEDKIVDGMPKDQMVKAIIDARYRNTY